MKKIVLLAACFLLLSGCAAGKRGTGFRVGVDVGNPSELNDSGSATVDGAGGYSANGYTVSVSRIGAEGKPQMIQGATVTCRAKLPKPHLITVATNSDGSAFFSVRGDAEFWVDYEGKTYKVPFAAHNSDTNPNQNIVEFTIP